MTQTRSHTNVATALAIVDNMRLVVFLWSWPHLSLKRSLGICTSARTNKVALLNKWDGKTVWRFLSGWGGKDGTAGGIIVRGKDKINGDNFTLLFPVLCYHHSRVATNPFLQSVNFTRQPSLTGNHGLMQLFVGTVLYTSADSQMTNDSHRKSCWLLFPEWRGTV